MSFFLVIHIIALIHTDIPLNIKKEIPKDKIKITKVFL